MRWLRFAIGLVGLSACSLFVSLEGLGSNDAGVDASPDGATMDVSASDAGQDVMAMPRTCDATFCDDFDDDAALGARWDMIVSDKDAGTLSRDPAEFKSPPHSMLVFVNKNVPDGEISLHKSFMVTSRLVVRFDLRIEQLASGGDELDLFGASYEPAPSGFDSYWIGISTYPKRADPVTLEIWAPLSDGGTTVSRTTSIPMTFGMWHSVMFDASFDTNTLGISVDNGAPTTLNMDNGAISSVEVALGATYVNNDTGGDGRIRFDNFQLWAYP